MRNLQVLWMVAAVAILAGCAGPAARTPSHPDVLAVLAPGGSFVNVGPNPQGAFEVLPGALPSGGYQVYFDAPYPTSLRMLFDNASLPRFEDLPTGSDPTVSGWFKIADINVNLTPPKWKVAIRPPQARLGAPGHVLSIFDVSNNPNFAIGTPEHESAPLVLNMVRRPRHVLTVVRAGSGSGTVHGDIAGIDCGNDCAEDFGQSRTITLTPHAGSNSRFVGWSADCPAPSRCSCAGTSCTVTLNDVVTVIASFASSSRPNEPPAACPGPRVDPTLTFVGGPNCATNIIDQHPSATLACDAAGFFCCESITGASDARCGGADRHQFPADCLAYSPAGGPPPSGPFDGCYRRN